MTVCEERNCPYYYAEEDEYARCHFEGYGMAPCEYDDEYTDDDDDDDYGDYYDDSDDEVGFDPFLGCYTDDC